MGSSFVCLYPPASMPGDDLLFHRLSDSTIGAVGFHGRVRDGIGWDTDAIATRQWSGRIETSHQSDTLMWFGLYPSQFAL